jgi:hypothetical protein
LGGVAGGTKYVVQDILFKYVIIWLSFTSGGLWSCVHW